MKVWVPIASAFVEGASQEVDKSSYRHLGLHLTTWVFLLAEQSVQPPKGFFAYLIQFSVDPECHSERGGTGLFRFSINLILL